MAFSFDRAGVVRLDGPLSEGLEFQEDGECFFMGSYDTSRRRCYAIFSCR
jgi:hypothetical protein